MKYSMCLGTVIDRPCTSAACGECKIVSECANFGRILSEYFSRRYSPSMTEEEKTALNEEYLQFRYDVIDAMNAASYIPFEKYLDVMIEELRKQLFFY